MRGAASSLSTVLSQVCGLYGKEYYQEEESPELRTDLSKSYSVQRTCSLNLCVRLYGAIQFIIVTGVGPQGHLHLVYNQELCGFANRFFKLTSSQRQSHSCPTKSSFGSFLAYEAAIMTQRCKILSGITTRKNNHTNWQLNLRQ